MPYPDSAAPPLATITATRQLDGVDRADQSVDPTLQSPNVVATLDAERLGIQAALDGGTGGVVGGSGTVGQRLTAIENTLAQLGVDPLLQGLTNYETPTPTDGSLLMFKGGALTVVPPAIWAGGAPPASLTTFIAAATPTGRVSFVTPQVLPSMTIGTAITAYTLQTQGGYGAKTYAVVSWNGITGLALNTATGVVTGTPTAAPNGVVSAPVFSVTDLFGFTATATMLAPVAAAGGTAPNFNMPPSLPNVGWVVGSTTATLDLSQYLSPGTGVGPFTYTSTSLPNKHVVLSSAGLLSCNAALTFQGDITIVVKCQGSNGQSTTDTAILTITATAPTGPTFDIAPYLSALGDDTHYAIGGGVVDPWANVQAIRAGAASMVTKGGTVYSSLGTKTSRYRLIIAPAPSATSWGALLNMGALLNCLIGNVETVVKAGTQSNAASTNNPAMMISFGGAASTAKINLDLYLNGNAANMLTSTPNNGLGTYFHGGLILNSPAWNGTVVAKNIRGVVGAKGTVNGVAADEVMHWETRHTIGGQPNTGTITVGCDDGSQAAGPDVGYGPDGRASGAAFQFMPSTSATDQITILAIGTGGCRHTLSQHCGGLLQILDDSVALNSHHGFQCEDGSPSDSQFKDVVQTRGLILGTNGGDGVLTWGCDVAIQHNGDGPVANSASIDIWNWVDQGSAVGLELDNKTPNYVHVHGCDITPSTSGGRAVKFNGGTQAVRDALAATVTFSGTCTTHLSGTAAKSAGSTNWNGTLN